MEGLPLCVSSIIRKSCRKEKHRRTLQGVHRYENLQMDHGLGAVEQAPGDDKKNQGTGHQHKAQDHSHPTNPIIWGCISYTFTGITFANLLIFYLLFLAANFLSIKIVSQKAGEYNYLLHRFPGYSAIENTLIYRKFSFIALDAFRSGRSRHPWTL